MQSWIKRTIIHSPIYLWLLFSNLQFFILKFVPISYSQWHSGILTLWQDCLNNCSREYWISCSISLLCTCFPMIYFAPPAFYWSTGAGNTGPWLDDGEIMPPVQWPGSTDIPVSKYLNISVLWLWAGAGWMAGPSWARPGPGTSPGPGDQFFLVPTRDQITLHRLHTHQQDNRD